MRKSTWAIATLLILCIFPSTSPAQEASKACTDSSRKAKDSVGIIIRDLTQARQNIQHTNDPKLGALLAGSIRLALLSCPFVIAEVAMYDSAIQKSQLANIDLAYPPTHQLYDAGALERGRSYYLLNGTYEAHGDGLFRFEATLLRIGLDGVIANAVARRLKPIEVREEEILRGIDLLSAEIINEIATIGPVAPPVAKLLTGCAQYSGGNALLQEDQNQKQVTTEVVEAFKRAIRETRNLRNTRTSETLGCTVISGDPVQTSEKSGADGLLYWATDYSTSNDFLAFKVTPKLFVPVLPSRESLILPTISGSTRSSLSLAVFGSQLESTVATFLAGAIGIDGKLRTAALTEYQAGVAKSSSTDQLIEQARKMISVRELDLATTLIMFGLSKYDQPRQRSLRGISDPSTPSIEEQTKDIDRGKLLALIAQIMLTKGDRISGRRLLIEAAKLAPREPTIHKTLAETYETEGNIGGAKESYLKFLDLEPDDIFARKKLGFIYLKYDDYKGARSQFIKVLALDPSNLEGADGLRQSWLGEAISAFDKNCNMSSSITAFEHLIKLDANDNWSALNLSELYILTEQYEKAESLSVQRLPTLNPNTTEQSALFLFLFKYTLLVAKLYQGTAEMASLVELEQLSRDLKISKNEWDFSLLNDSLQKSRWKDEDIKARILSLTNSVSDNGNNVNRTPQIHHCLQKAQSR